MRLLPLCAVLQCQTFEETIISDRAEKEAKRRQLEQDALELKSILKVKRKRGPKLRKCFSVSSWELRICATGFAQSANGLRKLAGVGWGK